MFSPSLPGQSVKKPIAFTREGEQHTFTVPTQCCNYSLAVYQNIVCRVLGHSVTPENATLTHDAEEITPTGLDGQEAVRTPNAPRDVVKLGGDQEDPRLAASVKYAE